MTESQAMALALEAQQYARTQGPFRYTITDPSPGDMTPAGDLIEAGRWTVTAWKTRSEKEDGLRVKAGSPQEVGEAVECLVRGGHFQIIVEDGTKPAPDA